MSINYTSYYSQLANMVPISTGDTNFATMMPGCIDYAEQRMYRDLDLLATRVTDATGSLSSANRQFTLPTGTGAFLVVEGVNVITPYTATSTSGTRVPLVMTSRDFIDITYPSNTGGAAVPEFFAMRDNASIIVGPPPDAAYPMEIIGTQRPAPLSSANSSTFLTQVLPDVFIAASMVFISGYTKDFSAQGDNPAQGNSWETQYKTLIASANVEELRKRYFSAGWTSQQPSPIATPARV